MRLFIALELSDEAKKNLASIQGELKKVDADIKWVEPQNIHLTLKFLGEVEEDKAGSIKKTIDNISSRKKPFELSLFKVGAFPSLNQIRVIWIGIDKGCSDAEDIAKSLESELEKLSFPKEGRPFSAHLTIARVRSAKNKSLLKEKIVSINVAPVSWTVNSITLFKSTLTPKGPIYAALHFGNFTAG